MGCVRETFAEVDSVYWYGADKEVIKPNGNDFQQKYIPQEIVRPALKYAVENRL